MIFSYLDNQEQIFAQALSKRFYTNLIPRITARTVQTAAESKFQRDPIFKMMLAKNKFMVMKPEDKSIHVMDNRLKWS